jgi:hypothetical protein
LTIAADINIPGFDMQTKRLNFKMDMVFFELRKSEQNENAGIGTKIHRLIE